MTRPIVSSVRARPAPTKLPQPQPQRGTNWPFPSSDPAERDRMAREHQAQQREAIVNGEKAKW